MTNNILRREKEHKQHFNKGFSDRYFIHKVVYYEVYETPREAIIREKRLKKWKRDWKIRLVEEVNPKWDDYLYLTKLK